MACSPGGRSCRRSCRPTPGPCCQSVIVPTALPWASLTSTLVLAVLGREKTITAMAVASGGRIIGFMREIIANFALIRPSGDKQAVLDPQAGGVYCEKVRNFFGKV